MTDEVAGQFAAHIVKKVEKFRVHRAGAVGLDEPLLAEFAFERFRGQRFNELLNAASGDVVAGEQIPHFLRNKWILLKRPDTVFAVFGLIQVRTSADNIDFEFLKIGENGKREIAIPRIIFGLEDIRDGKPPMRALGFTDKFLLAINPKLVVGPFLAGAALAARFDPDFAQVRRQTRAVADIPAKRFE
ncbi:MAG: hypothetical protein HY360_16825 [Verrucomicrobia bacterium]|nr:hypothetical protein [Verrucomicrobiota bacterium]